MQKEEQILIEVEKTLTSMDSLSSLEANPFLYTRISALLNSTDNSSRKVKSKVWQPAILIAFFVINIFAVVYSLQPSQGVNSDKDNLIYSLQNEYTVDDSQYFNLNR